MLVTLLVTLLTALVDIGAYLTGKFENLRWFWLQDSDGHVILPFLDEFEGAAGAAAYWMLTWIWFSGSASVASVPLLYYYGANRFRASGWPVTWAYLVTFLTLCRAVMLCAILALFHGKFLPALSGDEGLTLGEIVALYRINIIGWIPLTIAVNVVITGVLFVLLIISIRETNTWRRLNIRKIY